MSTTAGAVPLGAERQTASSILARLDRLPATRHIWMMVTLLSLGGMFEFYDLFMTGYVIPGLVKAGMLTGVFTLLPDRAEMEPALPLSLPPVASSPMMVLLAAPPSQPAFAPPSRATATPQMSTGALTGAFTSLPDSSDSTPALPLPLGPSANAALAGSTNPAVSTAVPIAAEIQRAFFIMLLLFRQAVACNAGLLICDETFPCPGLVSEPFRTESYHSITKSARAADGSGSAREMPRGARGGLVCG